MRRLVVVLMVGACTADEPADTSLSLVPVDRAACLVDPDCDYLFSVGHRGVLRHAPENTVKGFQMAEEMGLDAVELDVRPTLDGVLVCMHDGTVDRTTDGVGEVSQLTLAEVRGLLVESDVAGIADQPVPTFAEALAGLSEHTLVNVDAKTSRWDLIHADLQTAGMLDRAWVQTDDLAETAALVAAFPDLLLMPDVETAADVEAMAIYQPATVEIPNTLLDTAPFDAALAAGIKPATNALGLADTGALAQVERGEDGSAAYQVLVDRGARIIQTDVPELLVPAMIALNAERGWQP